MHVQYHVGVAWRWLLAFGLGGKGVGGQSNEERKRNKRIKNAFK